MRTEKEKQLISKIARNIDAVRSEEARAITSEMLNSKIGDCSIHMSDCSVAFALARYGDGCTFLAANNNKLGLQINAETLNAIIQQGEYAGWTVAFALAKHSTGQNILAVDNYTLALQINTKTLNAIIRQGSHIGQSVAFVLAGLPAGRAILAAKDKTLALRINEETLNATVRRFSSSYVPSVASCLQDDQGREILAAIKERHKNNKLMLALYLSKIERLGKNSAIKTLPRELIDGVATMLDGRTPKRLRLS